MKYIIDNDLPFDEGGSAEFYNIANNKDIGFKQFRNKKFAISARNKQKLLSRYNLAPRVLSGIIKIPIVCDRYHSETNWGYVTEKARLVDANVMQKRIFQIQELVENIHEKTGLKFWDCHYYNIGYVKRKNKPKLVCIDTGSESFLRDSNAWGFGFPGPKCNHCQKYDCVCVDY